MYVSSGKVEMGKSLSIIILITCLFPAACIKSVPYSDKDDSFIRVAAERNPWKTVAVLPFTGDIAYRRVCGAWFSFQLAKLQLFEMINSSISEIELRKYGIEATEANLDVETVREAGRMLGADAVLVGSVKMDQWQSAVVGVSLVDITSGKVVAMTSHPAYAIRNKYVVATEDAAWDISDVFYQITGKPRPNPQKGSSRPDEQRMPWSP